MKDHTPPHAEGAPRARTEADMKLKAPFRCIVLLAAMAVVVGGSPDPPAAQARIATVSLDREGASPGARVRANGAGFPADCLPAVQVGGEEVAASGGPASATGA